MEFLIDKLPYDPKSREDIIRYAKLLEGDSFKNIKTRSELRGLRKDSGKGRLGQLIESCYFFYSPNSDIKADFEDAGLELKVSPLKRVGKSLKAKERIVLSMINYISIVDENWEDSSFKRKNSNLLLVFYLYDKNKDYLEYKIKRVMIHTIDGADAEIIRSDWEKIVKKIRNGKAHELSEGDTLYLGACRKGKNNKEPESTQPYSEIRAKRRAFCLKQGYVNRILSRDNDSESFIKDSSMLGSNNLEKMILERINAYSGKSMDHLEEICNIPKKSGDNIPKNYYSMLAARMLGLHKKKIEEFEKADIKIKTIRINRNRTPVESMSFPAIDIERIKETPWESSDFYNHITKRFFFMIFKETEIGEYVFHKGMFWTMPKEDIDSAKEVWLLTRHKIKAGELELNTSSKNNPISHVRHHDRSKNHSKTKDGTNYTKSCFWLNSRYIKKIIGD